MSFFRLTQGPRSQSLPIQWKLFLRKGTEPLPHPPISHPSCGKTRLHGPGPSTRTDLDGWLKASRCGRRSQEARRTWPWAYPKVVVGGQAGRLHHRKGAEGGPGEGAEGAEAVLLLLVGTRVGVAE